ncbi:MAG: NAD(P)H-binding protein [Gammaproteobacteria bacterium]|nr:NAD(P)H-binding protein [Gammaproteobacteria bacterium]NND35748.1 NAD(P)H-binding protein [Gammaproteobacteria bacterium]
MKTLLNLLLFLISMTAVAEHHDNERVLVFGGTGRLGAPIVQLLVDAGYPVTVFARPTSNRERLTGYNVRYIIGDLMDADSVVAAIDGKSFAYVIDASARGASRNAFYDTAMRNILNAVSKGEVRQFILHGSVGAGDNMEKFPDIGFERMRGVMIAKGEAEAQLKSSGMPYTIIRNGFVKPDGTPATGTASLTEDDSVLEAVTRLDLAALTLQCLHNEECMNKTFHAVDD